MKRYGKSFVQSIYEHLAEAGCPTIPNVFEMKKKKGVWTYVPYIATLRMDGVDWNFNTSASVGGSPFVFFDECESSFDFDRVEATLQGRAFSGSTDAARASGLPKYAPTDSRSVRVRFKGAGILRDSLLEREIDVRQAIEAAIRRVL